MALSTDLKVDIEEFDLFQYQLQEDDNHPDDKTNIVFTSKEVLYSFSIIYFIIIIILFSLKRC